MNVINPINPINLPSPVKLSAFLPVLKTHEILPVVLWVTYHVNQVRTKSVTLADKEGQKEKLKVLKLSFFSTVFTVN